MDALNDLSPMPYGVHKDEPMEKVPAGYLLWMWDEFLHHEQTWEPKIAVRDYIIRSFGALEKEAHNYIVQHRPPP